MLEGFSIAMVDGQRVNGSNHGGLTCFDQQHMVNQGSRVAGDAWGMKHCNG